MPVHPAAVVALVAVLEPFAAGVAVAASEEEAGPVVAVLQDHQVAFRPADAVADVVAVAGAAAVHSYEALLPAFDCPPFVVVGAVGVIAAFDAVAEDAFGETFHPAAAAVQAAVPAVVEEGPAAWPSWIHLDQLAVAAAVPSFVAAPAHVPAEAHEAVQLPFQAFLAASGRKQLDQGCESLPFVQEHGTLPLAVHLHSRESQSCTLPEETC